MPTLFLMCGLPGSGKTTLASQIADQVGALHFCPDNELRRIGVSLKDDRARANIGRRLCAQASEMLSQETSVILDFGWWLKSERDDLRRLARELGCNIELHYLSAPLDTLWLRIERRNYELRRSADAVSRDELERWALIFEPPDAAELALFDLKTKR